MPEIAPDPATTPLPQVEDTVDALQRAVASAGLAPPQLSAVLLVGGLSRIPLVAQLVSDRSGIKKPGSRAGRAPMTGSAF
jgi:molecular chaperone DnaK (HSP70)